jgi:energy-coupling factor transporter ATP-binding protein EcfA2
VLTRPRLLVLDEPWSGLDKAAHQVLTGIIGEVTYAGGTVVFTDHREQFTRGIAGCRYLLDGGRLRPQPQPSRVVSAEVVLFADPDRPPRHAPQWSALAGVHGVDVRPEGTRIRVSVDAVEDLLTAALSAGWSVGRVEREDGARWSR